MITQPDFETLELETDDLIYADPPYDVEFVDCRTVELARTTDKCSF